MKRLIVCLLLMMLMFPSFSQVKKELIAIPIKWVTTIDADFSFKENFNYPDGIIKNEYGELICADDCSESLNSMKDSTGKIIPDSINVYYSFVDTTHQSHSIQSEAWCYEWAGTNFAEAYQQSIDTVFCYSLQNAATHCSLELKIVGNQCYASINLQSIIKGKSTMFQCSEGYITLDKQDWEKGFVKALFDFNFENKKQPNQPIFWKGKIYAKIKADESQL